MISLQTKSGQLPCGYIQLSELSLLFKKKKKRADTARRLTNVSAKHSCNFRSHAGGKVIQIDVTRRAVAFNTLGSSTGELQVRYQHTLPGPPVAESDSDPQTSSKML